MKADRQRSVIEVGGLRIDRARFEVKIHEREVHLSRKEFELLWTLTSEDGRAFRRDIALMEVIDPAWLPSFIEVHSGRMPQSAPE